MSRSKSWQPLLARWSRRCRQLCLPTTNNRKEIKFLQLRFGVLRVVYLDRPLFVLVICLVRTLEEEEKTWVARKHKKSIGPAILLRIGPPFSWPGGAAAKNTPSIVQRHLPTSPHARSLLGLPRLRCPGNRSMLFVVMPVNRVEWLLEGQLSGKGPIDNGPVEPLTWPL
ncbi:hypothetical protein BDP81DRAFT_24090 [Colletotrichum phormii]|uniref:Uncharacterized protein n=1 Tax=Colletotrichum phormii TaxID=359342 RepID=A0AAI9ZT49_9PEZI|nr:uncharacterized protein BDP81DRAFT_24090 [Colletotrichum phormii]KAK1636528.1 hypothetical protein BDP81DRAFT_24090 [Colletotrichum phormii]